MEYGCSVEYAKDNYFKRLCNKEIFVRHSEDKYLGNIEVLRSSSDLDTLEMTMAIERFRNWASAEGIYLPEPNEEDFLATIEMESQRVKGFI
jgi:hypothetical protein